MKFKEKFKEVYENGQNWAKKHKWLCRVLAVVLALFVAFTVVSVRSCSNDKKITASADSLYVPLSEEGYFIHTYYSPSVYVAWASSSSLYSRLVFAPVIIITPDGLSLSFGNSVQHFSGYSGSVSVGNIPFYNIYNSSGLYSVDTFGLSMDYNITYGSDFYSNLLSGAYVITNVKFLNTISYEVEAQSIFDYEILGTDGNNREVSFVTLHFVRSETSGNPAQLLVSSYISEGSWTNISFPFSLTYNGLSTSSAEYNEGFNRGRSEGQTIGYNSGYNDGKADGETIGYNRGISETLSDITPWQTIVDGVNSFLNIEILPNVKLSIILSVAFGVVLLGFAIKIFLGG